MIKIKLTVKTTVKILDVTSFFTMINAFFFLAKIAIYGEQIQQWKINGEAYLANIFIAKHLGVVIFLSLILFVLLKVRDKITGEDKIDMSAYDKTIQD